VAVVASKKKPKAEAESKRGNGPEEPAGAGSAGKRAKAVKAADKKAANTKAARKKTSSKKASSKKAASRKNAAASTKAQAGTMRAPAAGALGKRNASLAAGYAANDAAPVVDARDPFEVAKQTMKGSVTAIVEAMVAQAKKGSCSHAKTLLEMTGAKYMFGDEAETADIGEPWAKLVLERMDEAEQESLRERLTQDQPEAAAEP
jgi:hypothetical protein